LLTNLRFSGGFIFKVLEHPGKAGVPSTIWRTAGIVFPGKNAAIERVIPSSPLPSLSPAQKTETAQFFSL
jgi:hypothetical protein